VKKWLLIIVCIAQCLACQQQNSNKLTIATAANMQFAIKALQTAFTAETGIKTEAVISSSGKLTAQIKEGAPYDIFVSADMKYPTYLHQNGFTLSEPKIYAKGNLVLWTMLEEDLNMGLLSKENIKYIAIANPKTAPYGAAAKEVLTHYKLSEKVESKLVFGESIAQVNQFISSQTADIGFTAKSVVLSPKIKSKGQWIALDTNIYTPINQGIALLKTTEKRQKQAQAFYKFLLSAKGKEILTNFGYEVN